MEYQISSIPEFLIGHEKCTNSYYIIKNSPNEFIFSISKNIPKIGLSKYHFFPIWSKGSKKPDPEDYINCEKAFLHFINETEHALEGETLEEFITESANSILPDFLIAFNCFEKLDNNLMEREFLLKVINDKIFITEMFYIGGTIDLIPLNFEKSSREFNIFCTIRSCL